MPIREIVLGAFFTACFSLFLNYCMEEDEIFENYRPWLQKKFGTGRFAKLTKPLGECVVCMNSWFSILSFFGVVVFFSVSVWWLVPYISLSYVLLRIFYNLTEWL